MSKVLPFIALQEQRLKPMKEPDQKVMDALSHTFNSEKVAGLNNEQYKEYIQYCATLTLNTLINNEGKTFVKAFCEAALKSTDPRPVVNQVKSH